MITALSKPAYEGHSGDGITFARTEDDWVRVGIHFDGSERLIVFLDFEEIRAVLDGPIDAEPVRSTHNIIVPGEER